MTKLNQKGFAHILLFIIALIVLVVVCFAGWNAYQKNKPLPTTNTAGQTVQYDQAASRKLTNGDCSGAGSTTIIAPMRVDQIGMIQPYGLTIGGHVTPIDHQYYIGLDGNALRDTYDVLAPADGRIVNIQHRGDKTNTPPHTVDVPSSDEYRIVFAHTCSFLTYEDLVTSLAPDILAKLPGGHTLQGSAFVNVSIPIKKGQVIGHIGGQTLDFAVWDLAKPLSGFVDFAKDYLTAEPWKLYTAPTTNYLDSTIKSQVIAKYLRTTEPIDGKIDYDSDGKLIGSWFLQGSGGYHDPKNQDKFYWGGHLSIAPDYLDPSAYIASIGNYGSYPGAHINGGDGSDATQFMITSATPDPVNVGTNSGMVKYALAQKQYYVPSGESWNFGGFAINMKIHASTGTLATIAAQVTGSRMLKFEVFPGKTPAQVTSFDNGAKIYER